MPTNQRISEMTPAATLHGNDIIEIAQVNAGSSSGYASANTTLTAVGNELNKEIQYGDLKTTSKTPIGAINELSEDHNIADEFDAASTYDEGDFVIYEGNLYKCTTAITTAGAWDSTKWTQTIVVDEMGSGGGGGTTVVANPSGTATDDLEKIQIGSTIYDIPGTGGSSGGAFTLLWQNSDTAQSFGAQEITATGLSDYDWVGIVYNEASDSGGRNPIEMMIYANSSGAKTTTHMYSDTGVLIARAFTVSGDAVTFTDGFKPGVGYFSNFMIPVAIYGVQIGGGEGYQETVLWSGTQACTDSNFHELSLSDDYGDYDMIYFEVADNYSQKAYPIIPVNPIVLNAEYINMPYAGTNLGAYFKFTDDDTIEVARINQQNNLTYTKIVGIKFGGSGSGKGGIDYSTDEQDTGLKWIDGKSIYQKTWDFGSSGLTVDANQWVDTDILSSLVDRIIDVEAIAPTKARWDFVSATSDSTYIQLWQVRSTYSITVRYLTLKYTKPAS